MLKAVTWCAKCLFLYLLVAILSVRFSWVFTSPVWGVANKMHWTHLNRFSFVLSYYLLIFAVSGFLVGLLPWGKLGDALADLLHSVSPESAKFTVEDSLVPPILWAWLPVTLAFLIRFVGWQSRASSVFDAHRSQGRIDRFFGPLKDQTPALLDNRWIPDRFIFTGPMLFLMACAIACLIRYRLTRREPTTVVED